MMNLGNYFYFLFFRKGKLFAHFFVVAHFREFHNVPNTQLSDYIYIVRSRQQQQHQQQNFLFIYLLNFSLAFYFFQKRREIRLVCLDLFVFMCVFVAFE